MLNLGDVSIYATFGYLQEILQAEGYATAMAAGVPSFCAAAARLNVPLTGGMDAPLTIAPGGWADRVLETPGTKVLMKTGRQLPALLDTLEARRKLADSALVAIAVCRTKPSGPTFPLPGLNIRRAILPPFW